VVGNLAVQMQRLYAAVPQPDYRPSVVLPLNHAAVNVVTPPAPIREESPTDVVTAHTATVAITKAPTVPGTLATRSVAVAAAETSFSAGIMDLYKAKRGVSYGLISAGC